MIAIRVVLLDVKYLKAVLKCKLSDLDWARNTKVFSLKYINKYYRYARLDSRLQNNFAYYNIAYKFFLF